MHDRRNALVAADLLDGREIPCFEGQEVRLQHILTDRDAVLR